MKLHINMMKLHTMVKLHNMMKLHINMMKLHTMMKLHINMMKLHKIKNKSDSYSIKQKYSVLIITS